MLIMLSSDELVKCREFSFECAKNQQQIEFGQSDTAARGVREIGRDNLIGKIAEVAFSKMMKKYFNIDVPLDFNYYPRGKWDDQDAIINGWRIDIKGTRQGGKWMLIEWSKLNFRQKDNDLSHMFIMASVKWERETDSPTGTVDLVGSASIMKLKHGISKTKVLRKGECIPGTRTPLQADNFAISFDDLEHDWNMVINYITSHDPPDLSEYPNPYTGKPAVSSAAKTEDAPKEGFLSRLLKKLGF